MITLVFRYSIFIRGTNFVDDKKELNKVENRINKDIKGLGLYQFNSEKLPQNWIDQIKESLKFELCTCNIYTYGIKIFGVHRLDPDLIADDFDENAFDTYDFKYILQIPKIPATTYNFTYIDSTESDTEKKGKGNNKSSPKPSPRSSFKSEAYLIKKKSRIFTIIHGK
jgi:hypothetical protein